MKETELLEKKTNESQEFIKVLEQILLLKEQVKYVNSSHQIYC